jgi:hypothetical protein
MRCEFFLLLRVVLENITANENPLRPKVEGVF